LEAPEYFPQICLIGIILIFAIICDAVYLYISTQPDEKKKKIKPIPPLDGYEADTSKGGDPDVSKNLIKKMYKLDVDPSEEKEIDIKAIYLYPMRGVKGIKVDVAEI